MESVQATLLATNGRQPSAIVKRSKQPCHCRDGHDREAGHGDLSELVKVAALIKPDPRHKA